MWGLAFSFASMIHVIQNYTCESWLMVKFIILQGGGCSHKS